MSTIQQASSSFVLTLDNCSCLLSTLLNLSQLGMSVSYFWKLKQAPNLLLTCCRKDLCWLTAHLAPAKLKRHFLLIAQSDQARSIPHQPYLHNIKHRQLQPCDIIIIGRKASWTTLCNINVKCCSADETHGPKRPELLFWHLCCVKLFKKSFVHVWRNNEPLQYHHYHCVRISLVFGDRQLAHKYRQKQHEECLSAN